MRVRSVVVLMIVIAAIAAYYADRQNLPAEGGGNGTANSSSRGGSASFNAISAALVIIDTTLGEQQEQAAGTGVVLTSSGEVLTNNHVIAGATAIQATDVGNGQTYTATVAGYDRSHDVALLRLQNANGLSTAPLDTSGQPALGQQIAAVGNAGGTGSLTTAPGTITALGQSITATDEASGSSEQLTGLIQVKADVQPGDSGGALVESSGKVLGITTAASSGFHFRGNDSTAGFAIPITSALPIGRQIAAGQASSSVHIGPTAQLGVEVSSSPTTNGSAVDGAAVVGVLPGEPAETAGMTTGDVITSFGGAAVDSPTTLITLIDRDHPGQSVAVGWMDQSGQSQTATIALDTGPAG